MKVGLIGCGGMGSTHNNALRALSEVMDVEVTAIADCRPQFLKKAAEKWSQAVLYSDGEELIRKEQLEAVHICLPSYMHAGAAEAAMRRGMHVFVEKPVCLTREDCAKLLAVQQETGVTVMAGQVLRAFKEYRYLKKVYEEGVYGRLKSVMLRRISGDVTWGFEDWFHDEKKSGSVVLDLHIHDVDFLRWMLHEPDSFSVQASCFDSGMINHIVTQYRFGKVFVQAEGIWDESDAVVFQASYRACFEAATVELSADGTVTVYEKGTNGQPGRVVRPQLKEEYTKKDSSSGINISDQGPYYTEIKEFYTALSEGRPVEGASLAEGVRSVKLALKEWEAAKEFVRNTQE